MFRDRGKEVLQLTSLEATRVSCWMIDGTKLMKGPPFYVFIMEPVYGGTFVVL